MLRKWQNLSSVHNPGKTGIPAELLPELQQEVAAQLKALRNDCTSGNQSGIQDHMHQLKGLIEYFHMTAMDSDFRQLQRAITNGVPGEIADHLNALTATLENFSNSHD